MYSKEEKVQNYSTLCLGADKPSEQELATAKFNLQRYRPTP